MSRSRAAVSGLVALVLGAGLALLAASQSWATVHLARPKPLAPLVVELSGRTVQAAVPGLAVVGLAGAVALLATRGLLRRFVAALLVVAAVGLVLAAITGAGLSSGHARDLVTDSRPGAVIDPGAAVTVSHHLVWPVLAVVGACAMAAGALLAGLAGNAAAMSGRYDAPVTAAPPGAREAATSAAANSGSAPSDETSVGADGAATEESNLALWRRIDRGEDPTDGPSRTQS